MMIGIELVKDQAPQKPYPREENIGHWVVLCARRLGLIIRPLDNVIVLMPVPAMTREELKRTADITYDSIKSATETR